MSEFSGLKQIKPVSRGETSGNKHPKILENAPQIFTRFKRKDKNLKDPSPRALKRKKIVMALLGFALSFILVTSFLVYGVYKNARLFYADAQQLAASAKQQDLALIEQDLEKTKTSYQKLNNSYGLISWMRITPWLGKYVEDGRHGLNALGYGLDLGGIVTATLEPYADLLGFAATQDGQNAERTTQERIDVLIESLPQLLPQLDVISEKMGLMQQELSFIDPADYPQTFRGKAVRSQLSQGLDIIEEASTFVTQGKPLIEQSSYLLGLDEPRTYLVLFQNDKELRPTGGFLTAYSIMKVHKAKFEPVSSNDIYNLDALYKPSTPAPAPIVKYIRGPYILSKNLRLRDMNWSPDFYESMNTFMESAQKAGIKNIDGIVAVDTQVLVNILDVLGPIGVPGFGNFSTEIIPKCNCPQVVYELESFADVEGPVVWDPNTGKIVYSPPNMDNRKKIIGPLMNSIMAHSLGQPKEKLPDLFEAAFKSLTEKHVLLYMFDKEAQQAVEDFGIGGRITNHEQDYLHINDANLGGRKSNLYVTQEVHQEIMIDKDGTVEKTLTITYKNPQKHDGWLNSVLPNWVRIYVPKGSKLVAFEGVEDKQQVYDEFGKSVFAGFYELRPQGSVKITLKYILPFTLKDDYSLFIQKQPGTDAPLHSVSIGKTEEEFFLKTDKELKFKI